MTHISSLKALIIDSQHSVKSKSLRDWFPKHFTISILAIVTIFLINLLLIFVATFDRFNLIFAFKKRPKFLILDLLLLFLLQNCLISLVIRRWRWASKLMQNLISLRIVQVWVEVRVSLLTILNRTVDGLCLLLDLSLCNNHIKLRKNIEVCKTHTALILMRNRR